MILLFFGSSDVATTPAAVTGVTTITTPGLAADQTASPSVVSGVTTIATPTIFLGTSINKTAAVVNGVTTIGTPTIVLLEDPRIAPVAILGTTTIGAPAESVGVIVTPTLIQCRTTMGSVAVDVYSTFQPPSADLVPPIYTTRDRYQPVPATSIALFRHYKNRARGHSVLKTNGTYTITDYPTQDQIDAAQITYMGGHVYRVDTTEATALIAAGFSVS